MKEVPFLPMVLMVFLAGAAGAQPCLVGDLNGDCQVNGQDLEILSQQWLDAGCTGPSCADLDGADGVTVVDLALLAENWRARATSLVISEFMTLNGSKQPLAAGEILDEDGDSADWIEICNSTDVAVNLAGWYLTDDANDLIRWEFPSLQIKAGQFKIVFASGKNRDDPEGELHTNFQLRGSAGFLALVKPDGRTVVHAYEYPQQFGDVSYGLSSEAAGLATETILIRELAPARALIPTDGSLGLNWTELGFDDASWLAGTTGVGYDYGALIGLDVRAMRNVNQTVYVRIPFTVDDVSAVDELTLRMKYEDGFVAYLNGVALGGDNAPGLHELTWNSGATAVRDDNIAVNYQDFDITAYKDLLVAGDNVLAIHGLNAGAGSSDLLVLPELVATDIESVDLSSTIEGYFYQPTPGKANGSAVVNLGPAIRDVTENPPPPAGDEDLKVTAKVTETFDPVAVVMLVYRINFGQEVAVPMVDNGTASDAVADDGIYTGIIPSFVYGPGDMVRWKVVSPDIKGCASINPLFLIKEGRRQSPEYFGTVVVDPAIAAALPVFQYFVQNVSAAGTRSGTRASVFYLDEFYDNVFIRLRGGYTTQGRKFEFNDGHHFRFDPDIPRVDEINLNEAGRATNAQSAESTYMRQVLSWETYDNAGAPGSTSFPMHIRRNGRYLDVRIFIEQQDRDFLRREGLDPDGALYKMYNQLTSSTSGVEKKTRHHENNSDLQALVNGVSPGNPNRAVYLFDNVNIPAVINYIAATTIMHDNDHVQKNYFLYRDTEGTQEWMFVPWDKDLTFGRNWGISGIRARYDPYSHPLFGDDSHRKVDNLWNRLIDAIHDNSTARQMYLRRLRTLMDELLQPPGTPYNELKFEQRVGQLQAMLEGDVGSSAFYTEISRLKTDYLAVRRQHLFNNHSIHNPGYPDCAHIPDAQPNGVKIDFGAIEFNPPSGNQDEEYITLVNLNPTAVDISGWKLDEAVEHTFPPGTVIPAGSLFYVTPNAVAFRNRTTGPKGGQGLLVQGNYKGHLSSWGETINLLNKQGGLVSSMSYPGSPSGQQRFLRITEIMYNPAEGGDFDNEEYEYIELKNIGTTPLLLDGVRFTEGITFSFPGISLAAGDYVVVVANQAAFSSRHTVPEGVQVLAPYDGRLSNSGENVKLEDSTNSTILEFRYRDGWRDIADGDGFSLTIINPADADINSWGEKDAWRASAFYGGSPGWDDTGLVPEPGSVLINEVLAHAHAEAPDWIELHNTTGEAINIGGWFLSDDSNDVAKYEIADNTIIAADGYLVFYQDQHFGNPAVAGCHRAFALSENGEQVYLSSAQDGVLTGYQEVEDFGASATGIAFGRYYKESTDNFNFVAMSENTPGSANAYPLVGPIVINEIMYNPASGDQNEEYIELYNITAQPVTLYDYVTNEPWKFTDGIEYTFPSSPAVTIPAGGYLLVVKDPAAFVLRYGSMPAGVQVLGPYDGQLNNGGEKVELSMPGDVDGLGTRYYIRVDRVSYSDGAHPEDQPGGVDLWPVEADGAGMSLSRQVPGDYGNDVANWQAAVPSPGSANP